MPQGQKQDEGDLSLFLTRSPRQTFKRVEERLANVARYLSGWSYKHNDARELILVRKVAVAHDVWNSRFLCRSRNGARVVLSKVDSVKFLNFFHDELRHWST